MLGALGTQQKCRREESREVLLRNVFDKHA